jgi:hypothetical protein
MADQESAFVPAKLDVSMYNLGEQETTFFKEQTSITDDATLKDRILAVQAEAYEVSSLLSMRINSSDRYVTYSRRSSPILLGATVSLYSDIFIRRVSHSLSSLMNAEPCNPGYGYHGYRHTMIFCR